MSKSTPFKIEQEGYVSWLIFNRPEKRNAMNSDFFEGLIEQFQRFQKSPEVRVVVIRGEGKSFTAGTDIFQLSTLLQENGKNIRGELKEKILHFQEGINVIEKCQKPVIAAVHGHCIGGGVDLLCACDIRMASKDAVFSIRETKLALIADLGTLQRLPTIIGDGWFRELALTGRDFSAHEALNMGFITHLFEDRDTLYKAAKRKADEIAACSPQTVQGVKDVILYSREKGVYSGLEYVAEKNAAILPTKDLMEAFRAFMENRSPRFNGK